MATELKMKRSSVAAKVPTVSQLELGEIAINTFDGRMYIKKDDGIPTIVEIGGASSSNAAIYERDSFTATAGQTEFTISSVADLIEVYINGLLLNPTEDYTVSGNIITLLDPALLNDEVEIINYIKSSILSLDPTVNSITFNDIVGNATGGTLSWDSTSETLKIALDANNNLLVGQEEQFYVKATESISKGDLVMFAGVEGDHILVSKANPAATGFIPEWIVGVAKYALANNDFGYVTSFGKIEGLNTSLLTAGSLLYMHPTTPGALTTTKPTPPNHIILVAAVVRSNSSNGSYFVRITHQADTDETPEGSTNLYYTTARANSAIDTRVTKSFIDALNVDADTLDGKQLSTIEAAIEDAEILALAGL